MNYFLRPQVLLPVIIALPLIIISFFFDDSIIEFFQFLHNPLLDKLSYLVVESEFVFFVLIIMTALFMYEMRKTLWLIPLISTAIISFASSYLIKFIVMRPRPLGNLGILGFSDSSFPSSHAMIAFACAVILQREFHRISWFFYLFAIIISFARVYLAKHYLSDVLAGACFGYIIGHLLSYLSSKYIIGQNN